MTNESIVSSPEDTIRVRLVPVEVFGAGCDDRSHEDQWGYGLCDAVSAWSDCNRAEGHIFRFDDEFAAEFREPGETLTVQVNRAEYEAFSSRKWGDADGEARRVSTTVTVYREESWRTVAEACADQLRLTTAQLATVMAERDDAHARLAELEAH